MLSQHKNAEFALTPDQLDALIGACLSQRDQVAVSILAYTGIRRAELRGLCVADLDLPGGRILVRFGKGGKSRMIFIPPSLNQLLRGYVPTLSDGPLLPGASGQPLSLRTINNIVAAAGRRAAVRNPNPRYANINPHLLRHSFARNWKRASGSLESLQKLLGHASFQTTMDLYGIESLAETEDNYRRVVGRLVRTGNQRRAASALSSPDDRT